MLGEVLVTALDHAFKTSPRDMGEADSNLVYALIWQIELYADELCVTNLQAAEQIGVMCELTRMIELNVQLELKTSPQPEPKRTIS